MLEHPVRPGHPAVSEATIQRVRELCMALPGASEEPFGGHTNPSFRVGGKIFATINEAATALTCKAPPGAQEVLVGANPSRFFVPPYVGHRGWIGIRIGAAVDWDEVAGLLAQSHAMTAPKPKGARRRG